MLTAITLSLWLVTALFDYSEFCYTWQLKTYLWSRFRDFLTTPQGRVYWWRFRTGKQWVLALGLLGIVTSFRLERDATTWVLLIFLSLNLLYSLNEFRHKRFRRPALTPVAIGMIAASLVFEAWMVWFTANPAVIFGTIALRFIIISLFCGLIEPPRQLIISIRLYLAKKKLEQYPHLTIIGITGSYGKSTVKEFLSTILSEQFRVIATPQNINADIGISRFILDTDFTNADVFIVEMGAYRRGHIARVAKYVRPHIGILTAINEQHVSLFGSIEHTQQAKYELLRSVRPDGLAITNSDNALCRELISTLTVKVQTFGMSKEFSPTTSIASLSHDNDAVTMTMRYDNNIETTQHLPRAFEPYLMNILPCLMIGRELGLPPTTMDNGLQKLTLPKHGTQMYRYGQATIIDDSYSSNTDGFRLALKRLQTLGSGKKKIIITRGLIELGVLHERVHETLGEELALVADEVVIITPDAEQPLSRGIGRKNPHLPIHRYYDTDTQIAYIKTHRDTDVVILVENRIPAALQKELKRV